LLALLFVLTAVFIAFASAQLELRVRRAELRADDVEQPSLKPVS